MDNVLTMLREFIQNKNNWLTDLPKKYTLLQIAA